MIKPDFYIDTNVISFDLWCESKYLSILEEIRFDLLAEELTKEDYPLVPANDDYAIWFSLEDTENDHYEEDFEFLIDFYDDPEDYDDEEY